MTADAVSADISRAGDHYLDKWRRAIDDEMGDLYLSDAIATLEVAESPFEEDETPSTRSHLAIEGVLEAVVAIALDVRMIRLHLTGEG